MAVNTNFNTLTLIDDGIVLGCNNNRKIEISFSDLNKIYMKVCKLKPIYELLFILFPFLLVFVCVHYVVLEKLMAMALFLVVPVFMKTHSYKRNEMVISLKNGTVFRKKVSAKSKTENVIIINSVKREWLNYGVKMKKMDVL